MMSSLDLVRNVLLVALNGTEKQVFACTILNDEVRTITTLFRLIGLSLKLLGHANVECKVYIVNDDFY